MLLLTGAGLAVYAWPAPQETDSNGLLLIPLDARQEAMLWVAEAWAHVGRSHQAERARRLVAGDPGRARTHLQGAIRAYAFADEMLQHVHGEAPIASTKVFIFSRLAKHWEARDEFARQSAGLDLAEWTQLPMKCSPQALFGAEPLPAFLPAHPDLVLGGRWRENRLEGDSAWFGEADGLLVSAGFSFRSASIAGGPFLATQQRPFGVFGPDTLPADVIREWGLPNRVEWTRAWPPGPPDFGPEFLIYQRAGWCAEFYFSEGALRYLDVSLPPHCRSSSHDHYPGLTYRSSNSDAFDY